MYEPKLARFTSRDPLLNQNPILLGKLPEYAYADNNPVNNVDPSGLACCTCNSGLEKHHWFPQFGAGEDRKGPDEVNKICKGKNKINIDDYTTPMMNGCRNTPHWWMENEFEYNTKVKAIMKKHKGNCCMFLVAMIDLIHQAYGQLRSDRRAMNTLRVADGCKGSPMPLCKMQKFRPGKGPLIDTVKDLNKKASDACEGKTIKLGSKLRLRVNLRRTSPQLGCNKLKDPVVK